MPSTSYNHRKKNIRKFKKKFGSDWEKEYRNFVDEKFRKEHPLIGSLQDIMDSKIT